MHPRVQGDARFVRIGDAAVVEGDSGAARGEAGLHLLVLRLADLAELWSCAYDTHHDPAAAARLSDDLTRHALESKARASPRPAPSPSAARLQRLQRRRRRVPARRLPLCRRALPRGGRER